MPREFGTGEQVERVWLTAATLRPGCPLVSVSSADGGVGRSTLVAALGGLLSLACPDPVLAVDMGGSPWGGLRHRFRRTHGASVWDAVSAADQLVDRRAVERLVHRGPSGLHALVGEEHVSPGRRPPTSAEFGTLLGHIQQRRLYPLVLLDLPPAVTDFAWTALAWSIAPVVVARATQESLQHTLRLLAQLKAAGLRAMAESTVVAVMATTRSVAREVRATARQVRDVAGEVVRVPYDSVLARSEPIDPRALSRAARIALIDVAAAVLRRCPADPHLAAAAAAQPHA